MLISFKCTYRLLPGLHLALMINKDISDILKHKELWGMYCRLWNFQKLSFKKSYMCVYISVNSVFWTLAWCTSTIYGWYSMKLLMRWKIYGEKSILCSEFTRWAQCMSTGSTIIQEIIFHTAFATFKHQCRLLKTVACTQCAYGHNLRLFCPEARTERKYIRNIQWRKRRTYNHAD